MYTIYTIKTIKKGYIMYRKEGFLKRAFVVFSLMYVYIVMWIMIILAALYTWGMIDDYHIHGKDYLRIPIVWIIVLIPFILLTIYKKNLAAKSDKIIKYIKSTGIININSNYEYLEKISGGYLGVDTSSGVLLFIRPIQSVFYDVIGLNQKNIRKIENNGCEIKIYTYSLELPEIIFNPPNRAKVYETLAALLSKNHIDNNIPIKIAECIKIYAKEKHIVVPEY